ncbi:MAG: hypothetical protein ACI4QI_04870 [Candidatus Coproplasma sp.]
MIKALIKNEFIKVMRLSGRTKDKKKGLGGFANYLILMAVLGVLLAAMAFSMFMFMAPTFIQNGIGWLCFTYAAIMAVVFAVVGSVFMAQSQLYRAKDNDLLLSLPIPSPLILLCRMIPLYVQNFYFCFVILFPAYVAFCIAGGFSVLGLLFVVIDLIVIPLFTLTLCCLLGFLVAFVASRVKHSNIITVVLSILCLVAYFAVYSQMSTIISAMMENGAQAATGIMGYAYPLYLVGRSSEGDWLGGLVTFAICVVPFALIYLLLSKTYLGIITRKTSASKAVYKQSMVKSRSVWRSLIGKESKHFFRSTAYLLNCGMGVILLLIAAVYLIIWGRPLFVTLADSAPNIMNIIAPMLCIGICMLTSMDGITAPSVSLEGKGIWVLQSLPVESYKPMFAKVIFHVIFNTPVAIICGIVAAVSVNASALGYVAFILMPIATNFLFGSLGIIFNLKKPMMDWDNETVVIKQSISVLFLMLAVFVIFGVMAGLFFAANLIMSGELYLIICTVLLCAGAAGALCWIKKKGVLIWESL